MILRRISLIFALLCGAAFTQLPEFVEQYRQRLGGAIDELAADVARFDSESAQQGLSEAAGMDRLRTNSDPLASQRGLDVGEEVARLHKLRAAQAALRTEPPVARMAVVFTHWDERVTEGTLHDFAPAIPTSIEAVVLGAFGFAAGVGLTMMVGVPLRRRLREVYAN